MRTFAPSDGMMSGTRGGEAYQRSNSERWSCVGTGAVVAAAPASADAMTTSRGKKASVDAAPAKKITITTSASGLANTTRASRAARRGNVVIGKDVAAPDTMNNPITAA